jgi:hypothetical protein
MVAVGVDVVDAAVVVVETKGAVVVVVVVRQRNLNLDETKINIVT